MVKLLDLIRRVETAQDYRRFIKKWAITLNLFFSTGCLFALLFG